MFNFHFSSFMIQSNCWIFYLLFPNVNIYLNYHQIWMIDIMSAGLIVWPHLFTLIFRLQRQIKLFNLLLDLAFSKCLNVLHYNNINIFKSTQEQQFSTFNSNAINFKLGSIDLVLFQTFYTLSQRFPTWATWQISR